MAVLACDGGIEGDVTCPGLSTSAPESLPPLMQWLAVAECKQRIAERRKESQPERQCRPTESL